MSQMVAYFPQRHVVAFPVLTLSTFDCIQAATLHSQRIPLAIAKAMKDAQIKASDLAAVAYTRGNASLHPAWLADFVQDLDLLLVSISAPWLVEVWLQVCRSRQLEYITW